MLNLTQFCVLESWLKGTAVAVIVWVSVVLLTPLQVQLAQAVQVDPPLVEYSHTAESTSRPGARSRTWALAAGEPLEGSIAGKVRRTWQVRRT
jgi:hypothetical protein